LNFIHDIGALLKKLDEQLDDQDLKKALHILKVMNFATTAKRLS
jgi:hypothetical protein